MTEQRYVLLIEDDIDTRSLVAQLLEYEAIACIDVPTAEEALDHLNHNTPNLILSDLALPGMDGWALLRELQANPAWDSIPRVAMTAYHTVELAEKAIIEGFTAYFAKPLDAMTIAREVIAIIERHN